jgi:hypothetical protein
MPGENGDALFVRRVAAAAGAGWRTLGVGAILATVLGVMFLFLRACPQVQVWIAGLWGVPRETIALVWIGFIGALKLALTLWALGCVFLSLWWRGLARRDGAHTSGG